MLTPRIYQNRSFEEQSEIILDEWGSHHLVGVLRLKENDSFAIFNGKGNEYTAKILKIEKKKVFVEIQNRLEIDRESFLHIHLGQLITKSDSMDWVIQKATELGVSEITPLTGTRSVVQLKAEREVRKQEHWQKIIVRACEQCGRNRLPKLNATKSLEEWIRGVGEKTKLICDPFGSEMVAGEGEMQSTNENMTRNAAEKKNDNSNDNSIAILIGPEGGFTEQEALAAKRQGFRGITLGPRILRAETAAVAAIAVLQREFGDL